MKKKITYSAQSLLQKIIRNTASLFFKNLSFILSKNGKNTNFLKLFKIDALLFSALQLD